MDPTERIALVSKDEREIPIVRQCELVDVSRGLVCREKDKANDDPSHGESQENLDIMKIIDRVHLKYMGLSQDNGPSSELLWLPN